MVAPVWVHSDCVTCGVSATHTSHWRELPQVSFLSWEKFCRNKHVFVTPGLVPSFVATKVCWSWQNLSRQTYFCHDKIMFIATKVVSRQAYFCHDKHVFVATKHVFCYNKSVLVTTNMKFLSRQAYFYHDKRRVLSRQKLYLWHLPPMINTRLCSATFCASCCSQRKTKRRPQGRTRSCLP